MTKQTVQLHRQPQQKIVQRPKSARQKAADRQHAQQTPIVALQNQIGNAAVQRALAQRTGDGPTELDDTTADRINTARGGGQTLDTTIQQKMGEAMGSDFNGVRVHTSSESHQLNEQLGAKAFTTGNDVFFRKGEYNPGSSSGQELIAHELTHVVQQNSGVVPTNGSKMQVNPPGDQFEQEADAVAKQVTTMDSPTTQAKTGIQRQQLTDDDIQTKLLQRQEGEEDDLAAMEELPEDDERMAQRQEMSEDELAEDV